MILNINPMYLVMACLFIPFVMLIPCGIFNAFNQMEIADKVYTEEDLWKDLIGSGSPEAPRREDE